MEIYFHPFVNIAPLGRFTKECQETFGYDFINVLYHQQEDQDKVKIKSHNLWQTKKST